ncbi:MAG: SDR family NAD(P)-dependent oxidoreductase [Nitrosotalea sp.]
MKLLDRFQTNDSNISCTRDFPLTKNSKLRDKRVLVTGGAGFIGSEVVRQLHSLGAKIIVFDNYSSGRRRYIDKIPNVTQVRGSITNPSKVNDVVSKSDYIINLAALPFIPDSFYYPGEFFKVNAEGTINVTMAAIRSKRIKGFVHISTSEVYGTAKTVPMSEDHPTLPQSTYAASKLAGERAVFTLHKEHGLPAVIIRPFNSYGPRITQPYIIPEIISQIFHNKNFVKLGNVESSRDFTFVSDTARGMIAGLTAEKAIGETINVGSNTSYKIKDLVMQIAKIIGENVKIVIDKERFRPFDVQKLVCDYRKARKMLDWTPEIPIEEGLTKTIEWMKTNSPDFATPFEGWAKIYRMNLTQKK